MFVLQPVYGILVGLENDGDQVFIRLESRGVEATTSVPWMISVEDQGRELIVDDSRVSRWMRNSRVCSLGFLMILKLSMI